METLEAPPAIPASPTPPVQPVPPTAEALFKEAHRRRRNRRLLGSGIVVGVVALVGLVGLATAGGGSRTAPVIPLAQPAFASTVLKATAAADGASFTLVDRGGPAACPSNPGPQVVIFRGSVDFARQVMSYSSVDRSCPVIPRPLTILTPTATYERFGSTIAPGIGTDASTPWLESPATLQDPGFSVVSTMLYPDLGALLRAVPGPLVRGRTAVIGGVSSTEYRGTTTLARLEDSSGVAPTAAVRPDAASIVVPIGIWVDARGRITRVTASEPIFSDRYTDGSTQTAAQVSATSTEVPPAPATSSPRDAGVADLVLTFTGFGHQAVSVPPAAETVASDGHH